MSHERHDAVFYDSEAHPSFRDALVDKIIVPAYMTAIDYGKSDQDTERGYTMVDCETEYDDCRAEYDFYAQVDDDTVTVRSILSGGVGQQDLTNEAIRLIHDEIQSADMSDRIKQRFNGRYKELRESVSIETFKRREFHIRLHDGDVQVQTDIGYSIEGMPIEPPFDENAPDLPPELVAYEKVIETDDLIELIRALIAMELISQSDVKKFLDMF
jgi:hypothetical protein